MKYAFFRVPAAGGDTESKELNSFLTRHRIIRVDKEFLVQTNNPCWVFCVEYYEQENGSGQKYQNKVDYKEILSEQDFAVFSVLRDVRKKIADENGLPLYAIFTNQQLSEMAVKRVKSRGEMEKIDGVGKGKLDKYSEIFLTALREHIGEAGGKPV